MINLSAEEQENLIKNTTERESVIRGNILMVAQRYNKRQSKSEWYIVCTFGNSLIKIANTLNGFVKDGIIECDSYFTREGVYQSIHNVCQHKNYYFFEEFIWNQGGRPPGSEDKQRRYLDCHCYSRSLDYKRKGSIATISKELQISGSPIREICKGDLMFVKNFHFTYHPMSLEEILWKRNAYKVYLEWITAFKDEEWPVIIKTSSYLVEAIIIEEDKFTPLLFKAKTKGGLTISVKATDIVACNRESFDKESGDFTHDMFEGNWSVLISLDEARELGFTPNLKWQEYYKEEYYYEG